MKSITKIQILILSLVLLQGPSFSQENPVESQSPIRHFSGTITATNNGVSIIPAFNLGKPAAFFDLSVGGERLSFDPMFRFGMNGKPWSFILWWRYKIIKDKKFSLTAGAHPAFLFQDREVMVDGEVQRMFVANRFLAGEINQSYKFSNKLSMGIYYLHGTGFNPTGPKNSDFVALNTVISNIRLGGDFSLRINPQLFFLSVDENSGTYINSSFTFSKDEFPISFQTFFNQKIKSQVAGDDLVWNMSLLYTFKNTYAKK
ncbi:hypothetical protein SAMN04488519_11166 [Algoriphagus ornithinivorans]|uniref:DUF481 domain-containing protein n=2 Tax=Algoriphagus TaxID=246875 RepID=A0A1I5J5E7_9BACT|nr:hypothetical protein [Algoriphagus ornithinivorans]SFO67606.1 hypothetical protein SAMN04488519_11166 [Algoriphagus ornithinivorans]